MAGTAAFGVGSDGWFTAVQAVEPAAILDASGPVLATLAFVATVLSGGAVLSVAGGRIDDAVDASMANPLVSVVYGLVAFGLVVFLVGYAVSQLSRFGVASGVLATLLLIVLCLLVLSLSGFGFVVVGAWLTTAVGGREPWVGLVAVGLVCATVWLVLPFAVAAVVWLALACLGVGGPTRRWIHADEAEATPG
ncbi:hypothetical protein [Halomarina salina]|uniref:hypothetical protein n=1 Tax=Halomarina salina TaxID=1872699 RepID=UPI001FFB12E4|nr:hypothetical protein [Halomarina salina]